MSETIDVTDYQALARERGALLGRLSVIKEFMREITGNDYPCTDPGGHASGED